MLLLLCVLYFGLSWPFFPLLLAQQGKVHHPELQRGMESKLKKKRLIYAYRSRVLKESFHWKEFSLFAFQDSAAVFIFLNSAWWIHSLSTFSQVNKKYEYTTIVKERYKKSMFIVDDVFRYEINSRSCTEWGSQPLQHRFNSTTGFGLGMWCCHFSCNFILKSSASVGIDWNS